MTVGPDPARLADARRRAALAAEHVPERSNQDASRILAFDVLLEYVEDIYDGEPAQLVWALKLAAEATGLPSHEAQLRDDAWAKFQTGGNANAPGTRR